MAYLRAKATAPILCCLLTAALAGRVSLRDVEARASRQGKQNAGTAMLDSSLLRKSHDCPEPCSSTNAALCAGVNQTPTTYPNIPVTSDLPKNMITSIISILPLADFGTIINFGINAFWPQGDSMIDAMADWTKIFVQQEIQAQHVKDLQNYLNGVRKSLAETGVLAFNSTQQITRMDALDIDLGTWEYVFSDETLTWQGMSLFPTYVGLRLTVKTYVFHAHPINAVSNYNITGDMVSRYQVTAINFNESIITNRLSTISELTETDPSTYLGCYPTKWVADDQWDTDCSWEIYTTARVVYHSVGSQYCYHQDYDYCPQLRPGADTCRNNHINAVRSSWATWWNDFLIEPSKEWGRYVAEMEKLLLLGDV